MKNFVLGNALFLVAAFALAQGARPTDPQIAHIVVTANQVDIDAGRLAESKGTTDQVKAFGRQMVAEVLIPDAKNEELKSLIVKVRPAFVGHLEHAKMIQASLAKQ